MALCIGALSFKLHDILFILRSFCEYLWSASWCRVGRWIYKKSETALLVLGLDEVLVQADAGVNLVSGDAGWDGARSLRSASTLLGLLVLLSSSLEHLPEAVPFGNEFSAPPAGDPQRMAVGMNEKVKE